MHMYHRSNYIVSVVCLYAASRYQGNHDRNQTMGQSRMDMDILFPETKYFYLTNSSICAEKLLEVVMSLYVSSR